jgi:hypothetical protein
MNAEAIAEFEADIAQCADGVLADAETGAITSRIKMREQLRSAISLLSWLEQPLITKLVPGYANNRGHLFSKAVTHGYRCLRNSDLYRNVPPNDMPVNPDVEKLILLQVDQRRIHAYADTLQADADRVILESRGSHVFDTNFSLDVTTIGGEQLCKVEDALSLAEVMLRNVTS